MEWDSADKTAEEQLIFDFRLIVKSSKGLKLYRDGKDSKMLKIQSVATKGWNIEHKVKELHDMSSNV